MRALSKLIYLNNPDLVLFVGEALVGNDAVDQLSKFNQVQFLYPGFYCVIYFSCIQIQIIEQHSLLFFFAEIRRPIYFTQS
jgi:hypothetical protein